jgi:hypothetical protein
LRKDSELLSDGPAVKRAEISIKRRRNCKAKPANIISIMYLQLYPASSSRPPNSLMHSTPVSEDIGHGMKTRTSTALVKPEMTSAPVGIASQLLLTIAGCTSFLALVTKIPTRYVRGSVLDPSDPNLYPSRADVVNP